jgi:hypothetical protein
MKGGDKLLELRERTGEVLSKKVEIILIGQNKGD